MAGSIGSVDPGGDVGRTNDVCAHRRLSAVDQPVRTMRLSDEFIATVDAWASRQDDTPSRSEAIRRLVELGLKAKTKP